MMRELTKDPCKLMPYPLHDLWYFHLIATEYLCLEWVVCLEILLQFKWQPFVMGVFILTVLLVMKHVVRSSISYEGVIAFLSLCMDVVFLF